MAGFRTQCFRSTRAKILKEFLGRPHLFCTPHFRERYEAQARRNLQHSLVTLEGLGATGSAGG
jgi:predicted metal-dependent HD superfamily phosphohydrolase